ncbi:hypothetical protein BKA65DRAFT_534748 [Rhexocercosporidium sp. MPI-PUGE-AT-0058]|nr:hypothetical protein BKA65DRAFT_534748 [Rhexocercosporidium sp. MPI-PUGE-AT-0058]
MDSVDCLESIYSQIEAGIVVANTIPVRVRADQVTLKPSADSRSRKGLFLVQDVKAGDSLVLLNYPLVKTVTDGPMFRSKICEFCSSKAEGETKFNVCSSCGVNYYCTKECLASAWKLYRKKECVSLRTTRQAEDRCGGHLLIDSKLYRSAMRIIWLKFSNTMIYGEWSEVLEAGKLKKGEDDSDDDLKAMAALLVRYSFTTLEVRLSLIRLDKEVVKNAGSRATGKEVLWVDPFIAGIRQSPEANFRLMVHDAQLQIKAEKDIARGEEITIQACT